MAGIFVSAINCIFNHFCEGVWSGFLKTGKNVVFVSKISAFDGYRLRKIRLVSSYRQTDSIFNFMIIREVLASQGMLHRLLISTSRVQYAGEGCYNAKLACCASAYIAIFFLSTFISNTSIIFLCRISFCYLKMTNLLVLLRKYSFFFVGELIEPKIAPFKI